MAERVVCNAEEKVSREGEWSNPPDGNWRWNPKEGRSGGRREGVDAALGETAQVNGVLLDVLGGPIGEGNVEREGAEPFPLLLLQPRLFGQFGGAGVIAGGQGLFLKGIAEDLLIKVKWKFQNIEFEKKGIRNQAAEQFKIERAAGQGGVWYRFRPVSVCLDKQLPRRNKYAGTC
ncbi:MAG: hypothetical protein ACLR1T_12230 [Evtepia gabavorous]